MSWLFQHILFSTHSIISTHYTALSRSPLWLITLSIVWLYFAGTFFFDVIHYILHRCSKSSSAILRSIGKIHLVHHLYFNRRLEFNLKYKWHNLLIETPLELTCQIVGSYIGYHLTTNHLPIELLHLVFTIQTLRVLVVLFLVGEDSNHIPYTTLPKDPNLLLVGPEYHALHHIYPEAYISSFIRIFDLILGLNATFKNKRITVTGSSGAFGTAISKQLKREDVKCINKLKYNVNWSYDNYEETIPILQNTDILILAHGVKTSDRSIAMQANCTSPKTIISLFLQHHTPIPGLASSKFHIPEIWYCGSESEIHPSFSDPSLQSYSASKRAFLPFAKSLYGDDKVVYRHLVLAAFESGMGWGVVSADWVARWVVWWVRRGSEVVLVSYTGMAVLCWVKFRVWVVGERGVRNKGRLSRSN